MQKKYNIIYADPPWQYSDKRCNGACENHYNTMKIDDICNLQISEICAEDCVLFLWTTYPMLQEAIRLINAWGFKYKTIGFQWIKQNKSGNGYFFGLGRWTRGNTEPVLIAVKGKPKRIANNISQLVFSPIGKHSEKPAIVREKIVKLIGDLPRIELFARAKSEGWDVWGNEVDSDVKIGGGGLMINVDLKDIKQFKKNLENTAVDAYPKTVRATLDREAFLGLEQYKKNINAKFVIRNKGYLKSLRYQKCGSSLKINKMVAKTGQSARTFGKVTDGFEKQELGLPIIANKKHIAKALKTARGGNYKKLVAKKNTLQNINNVKTIKDLVKNPAKTAEEQFKQAIGVAHHAHKLVNFLPKKSERGQSIIQIEPKKSGKVNKTAKYLYSLKGRVQLLKRVPTLEPAAKLAGSKGGEVFIHEAKRRLFKELSKNLQKC